MFVGINNTLFFMFDHNSSPLLFYLDCKDCILRHVFRLRTFSEPPCDFTKYTDYISCAVTNGCFEAAGVDPDARVLPENARPIDGINCVFNKCLSESRAIFDEEPVECLNCLSVAVMSSLE